MAADTAVVQVPVLKAKIGGVWTEVQSSSAGQFDFPSSYDQIKAAGAAP